ALTSGVDMDMVGASYMKFLKANHDAGKVSMADIDDACRRVLEVKYDIGLFEDPYRYSDEKRERETIYKKEHLDAALEVANKSIVLLKNNNVLPLNKQQKVAFVGPFVRDEYHIIGSWAALGERDGYATSLEEGIFNLLGRNTTATFDEGVDIESDKTEKMAAALANAAKADVIVAVMGEREN